MACGMVIWPLLDTVAFMWLNVRSELSNHKQPLFPKPSFECLLPAAASETLTTMKPLRSLIRLVAVEGTRLDFLNLKSQIPNLRSAGLSLFLLAVAILPP